MSDQIRVLVVDDDAMTNMMVCEALAAGGFTTVEAFDGRSALAMFDTECPDAILLDINMPELDGYAVCTAIRSRPDGSDVPILVMTAAEDVEDIERAFQVGATDFMTKPLNPCLLPHRVRYMLRAAETARASRIAATRLGQAQALAGIAHWRLDSAGTFTWASDPYAVFWLDSPAHPPPAAPLLDLVHVDDRARLEGLLAARTAHDIQFRIVLPSGLERVVKQTAANYDGTLVGATQDITAAKHAEERISQLAFYDDLTGIPNRQFVDCYLATVDALQPRSAISIDLGLCQHARLSEGARDMLVRAATARIIDRVRGDDLELRLDCVPRHVESYTKPTVVARVRPDELLVLGEPGAAVVARRIAEALARPFTIDDESIIVRPRFGTAEYPDAVDTLSALQEQARTAMLDAERVAPRDVVSYGEALRRRHTRRASLVRMLERALDTAGHGPSDTLVVGYEPRFAALASPRVRVIGVRARPVWSDGEITDAELQETMAAHSGLQARLALWMLGSITRDSASWPASLRVAVELSGTQLASPTVGARIREVLTSSTFDPSCLDLELFDIPEHDDELARLTRLASELRGMGARIALARVDDTTPIRALRRLPLHAVQVHHGTLERAPGLFHTLATAAETLGLGLVICGVDTPAALADLDLRCIDELAGVALGAMRVGHPDARAVTPTAS